MGFAFREVEVGMEDEVGDMSAARGGVRWWSEDMALRVCVRAEAPEERAARPSSYELRRHRYLDG